ncbi:DUF58 domain-containing protein [Candidatus Woesearchaeota archaeon]|nr:MAG: DUF58 domain-containing protein [Candidatus Woesearchaeota archaeon]
MAVKHLNINLQRRLKNTTIATKRHILSHILEGAWTTLRKGAGMEFAGYRQYTYSDDASLIDWGASLRAKETLVREFEEYKTFNVFFLLDVSDSMLFSSTGKLKAEFAAEVTFDLTVATSEGGEAIGLALFTDKLVTAIAPNVGGGVIHRVMKELQNPLNYGGPIDAAKALQLSNLYLPSHQTVIVLISDFFGFRPGWERYLKSLVQRFDVIAIIIRDPRDETLPKYAGEYYVKDPYSGQVMLIDTKTTSHMFAQAVKEEDKRLANTFKETKTSYVKLYTNEDYYRKLFLFFRQLSKKRGR